MNDDRMEDVRAELDAMDRCSAIILKLKPEQIVRVVEWLGRQFSPRDQLTALFRQTIEQQVNHPLQPGGGTKYGGVPPRPSQPPSYLKAIKGGQQDGF